MRILSFSSYFLAKNPLRQDFLALVVAFVSSTVLVLGASISDFLTDFSAVLGFVVLALVDLADDFDFLVALVTSLNNNFYYYNTVFVCYNEKVNNLFRKEDGCNSK